MIIPLLHLRHLHHHLSVNQYREAHPRDAPYKDVRQDDHHREIIMDSDDVTIDDEDDTIEGSGTLHIRSALRPVQ